MYIIPFMWIPTYPLYFIFDEPFFIREQSLIQILIPVKRLMLENIIVIGSATIDRAIEYFRDTIHRSELCLK